MSSPDILQNGQIRTVTRGLTVHSVYLKVYSPIQVLERIRDLWRFKAVGQSEVLRASAKILLRHTTPGVVRRENICRSPGCGARLSPTTKRQYCDECAAANGAEARRAKDAAKRNAEIEPTEIEKARRKFITSQWRIPS